MKKTGLFASIFVFSTCLVGCIDQADTNEQTEEITKELQTVSTTKADETLLNIEEFLKRMEQMPAELTSFATDTTITTITTIDEKEQTVPMTISTAVTTEPLRIKQRLQMDWREQNLGHINSESYMQDGFMYIQHPEDGTWVKAAIPQFDAFAQQIMKQSPTEQMKLIQEQAHLFTVRETKTEYLLFFKGNKDTIEHILDEQLGSILKDNTLPITTNKTHVYETLSYNIVLNKETLFPVSLEMTTELTNTEDKGKTRTKLEMKAVYRDVNTLKSIELPEEAKSAKAI